MIVPDAILKELKRLRKVWPPLCKRCEKECIPNNKDCFRFIKEGGKPIYFCSLECYYKWRTKRDANT
jgi:hypothetical protein